MESSIAIMQEIINHQCARISELRTELQLAAKVLEPYQNWPFDIALRKTHKSISNILNSKELY